MRNLNILYIFIAILLFSCNGSEPDSPYVYEANPHYSFGYIQFYGLFYKNVGNPNNILTISLFSDSLYISEEGSLEGFGQFLYLEDVYNSPTDTLLHTTTYTVNESRDPYTISAGKNDTIDKNEPSTVADTTKPEPTKDVKEEQKNSPPVNKSNTKDKGKPITGLLDILKKPDIGRGNNSSDESLPPTSGD